LIRQDRFLTAILIVIGLLVVAAVGLYFLRQDRADYLPGSTPEEVVHNYVLAVQNRDYPRAYTYLADTPTRPSVENFRQGLLNQRGDFSTAAVEIGSARIQGDEAEVDVAIVRANADLFGDLYRDQQVALLRREGDSWKIVQMAYPYWVWEWSPENTTPAKPVPAPTGG